MALIVGANLGAVAWPDPGDTSTLANAYARIETLRIETQPDKTYRTHVVVSIWRRKQAWQAGKPRVDVWDDRMTDAETRTAFGLGAGAGESQVNVKPIDQIYAWLLTKAPFLNWTTD
jgi:hypothetical protein